MIMGSSEAIPAGLILLLDGPSCPAGYTRLAAMDGKYIRPSTVVNYDAGGSDTHAHAASTSHSHNLPDHTHDVSHSHSITSVETGYANDLIQKQEGPNTNTRLIESNHNHGLSGSSDVAGVTSDSAGGGLDAASPASGPGSNMPPTADVLLCRKD